MQYGFIIPRGSVQDILALAVEAEDAGWDGFSGRYAFTHATIRETLYADLPTAQRLRLHRRNRQERRRGGKTGRECCQAKLFHDCHRYSNDVGRAWPVFSHSINDRCRTSVIRNW